MSVAPIALPRAIGEARVVFKRRDEATVLQDLYQQGCCKVRFPRIDPGEPLQAVLLNTAGGLTDGDHVRQTVTWRENTHAIVTTQAAERIYRSRGEMAVVHNALEVRAGARAIWLPQETILFEGSRLERHWRADLAPDAMLFAAETWTLGRAAMGETVGAPRSRRCGQHGAWSGRYVGRSHTNRRFGAGQGFGKKRGTSSYDFASVIRSPTVGCGRYASTNGMPGTPSV